MSYKLISTIIIYTCIFGRAKSNAWVEDLLCLWINSSWLGINCYILASSTCRILREYPSKKTNIMQSELVDKVHFVLCCNRNNGYFFMQINKRASILFHLNNITSIADSLLLQQVFDLNDSTNISRNSSNELNSIHSNISYHRGQQWFGGWSRHVSKT